MKRFAAFVLLLAAPVVRADAVSSPFSMAARLEARIASGDGVTLPDAEMEVVRHAGTVDLARGDWPEAFHARAGETVGVAVSPFTGCYEFFDARGDVFWTVVPVFPTTDNWVAPFRRAEAGPKPDDGLYASWRLVDAWKLSHAESAKSAEFFDLGFGFADNGGRLRFVDNPRGVAAPATNLRFTDFTLDETNLFFTVFWPTNDALPDNVLDLYGSTNLSSRWTFLSSHPATNPPVAFSVDPATLPWHVAPTSHVHDASCAAVTNIVVSPLDGITVYTNEIWSCATNVVRRPPGFFRLGTHHDLDGDGLFDAFELLSFGTSTNAFDTDGDGLSDGAEWSAGTDPLDPDTDGDGVPDGLTAAEWLAHPLWAADMASADLVVFLYEPVANGVAALRFDDLCIPLSTNAGPWCLSIPTNAVVTCRLVSGADTTVMLWYGPPEAVVQTRSAPAPGWDVPSSVARPVWCDRPAAVFGGNRGGGTCRFARPVLVVENEDLPGSPATGVCVHSADGRARFAWRVEPAACTGLCVSAAGASVIGGSDDRRFALDVSGQTPGPAGTVGASFSVGSVQPPFFGENVLFGTLDGFASAHPHAAWGGLLRDCAVCGGPHGLPGSSTSCYHDPACAAMSDETADCDCAEPFVRIGSAGALRLVGSVSQGGCCEWDETLQSDAELLAAPTDLGAAVSNGVLFVAPVSESPVIGGFTARYRIFLPDGSTRRELAVPFTCADLGIDPLLANAPVPSDWQDEPEAYYVTNDTLYVAKRTAPYPIRLWNESPSDARLVFAFASPTNGPGLFDPSLGTRHSSLVTTNAAPFAALNDDRTVYLDALCSNVLATLSLTLSDPIADRTFLSESLAVKVVDTDVGEHWRVRSATDTISWDFSDAPEDVYAYLWRPNADGPFGDLVGFTLGKTPSLSLDLPPGDYLLDFYFPRVYDGGSWAAWSTNYLHIVHTEVTPLENLRFTNATERACFALTNNNGQAANWTISPVVAGGPMLHASKTGGAGSATHVDNATSVWVQAGTAPGRYTITATHPNCPVSTADATFTVGRVDVESLLFNWDTTGSARDAINLRWNYKDAINLATGEWTRAGYRAPACYVTNASPLVKATFSVAPTTLPEVRLFAETAAAIGGFAITNVSFSNGAASNVVLSTRSATTNCVLKETFELAWKAVVSNETEVVTNTLGKTDGHVFYTILDEPKLPWSNAYGVSSNAWAEALEFVISNACFGVTTEKEGLKKLTSYFFGSHGVSYETNNGRTAYRPMISYHPERYAFEYSAYLEKSRGSIVNCYDQAGALWISGALAGISSDLMFMRPFGYIVETNLVGIGSCNNPFFSNPIYDSRMVCPTNEPTRSGFGNHMFVKHSSGCFDACAGPALGQWTLSEYVSNVIDTATTNTWYKTGVTTNATPFLKIKEIR